MPTQTRVKQFTTGRLSGINYETGWQTLVQNLNDWFALPATNIIFLDAHIEVRYSDQRGLDSITLYIMYLDSDAGVRVEYRAKGQTNNPNLDFPAWFAQETDATSAAEQPVWIGAADPLPTKDTQFGNQFLYIYTDKTTNPNQIGYRTAVFAAVSIAKFGIAPLAAGLANIFNSEGTWVAQVTIRNISNTHTWGFDELGLVTVDSGAYGITAQYIGLPMCCVNGPLSAPP